MSKKTVRNVSKIKEAKAKKRKHVTYNVKTKKPKNTEQKIFQKVKTYVENNEEGIDVETLTPEDAIRLCKEKVADMLYFHYYLIFVQEMIESEILLSFVMKYDVKRASIRIRNVNTAITHLDSLEDGLFYSELIRISDEVKNLSLDIYEEIFRADKISRWIDSMVFARGKYLPGLDNGAERSSDEIYTEVLRITAINYLANNVLSIGLPNSPLEHELRNPVKGNE